MPISEKTKHILAELKGHAPFTFFGAVLGIIFMLIFTRFTTTTSRILFTIFHPAHVVISAMVTTAMFKIHTAKRRIILIIAIGYLGSIGIATLSDILIPHLGSHLLDLNIPTHTQMHDDHPSEPTEHKIHLAFIADWYIVNPAAILGIAIALLIPRTKLPHAAHVLISTWASMSYLLMDIQPQLTITAILGVLAILFLATWLPCCVSDIIFPLLFAKSDLTLNEICLCDDHARHSHPHQHQHSEDCPTGQDHTKAQ